MMKWLAGWTMLIMALASFLACGGNSNPGQDLNLKDLSEAEIYTRMTQAMTRPDQVYHVVIEIHQQAGPLSYTGELESWVDIAGDRAREVSILTRTNGAESRQEAILVDGMVHAIVIPPDSRESALPPRKAIPCFEASPLVSTLLACWRFDRVGATSVAVDRYQSKAAIVMENEVAWSGSDERFAVSRRLFLDADTFLPLALRLEGTVDYGEVLPMQGAWEYRNEFVPLNALSEGFFIP